VIRCPPYLGCVSKRAPVGGSSTGEGVQILAGFYLCEPLKLPQIRLLICAAGRNLENDFAEFRRLHVFGDKFRGCDRL
jgi:hypothetical protein